MDAQEIADCHLAWVVTDGREGFKPGSYMELIIKAMMKADARNLAKLADAYPQHFEAYKEQILEG